MARAVGTTRIRDYDAGTPPRSLGYSTRRFAHGCGTGAMRDVDFRETRLEEVPSRVFVHDEKVAVSVIRDALRWRANCGRPLGRTHPRFLDCLAPSPSLRSWLLDLQLVGSYTGPQKRRLL